MGVIPDGVTGVPAKMTGGPSDQAVDRLTARYALVLRVGGTIAYVIVGALSATDGVSARWLAAVLLILCAWSAIFALLVLRTGLTWQVVLADTLVVGVLTLAQRRVVPSEMTADETSWMLSLACSPAFITQLGLPPRVGLPVAGAFSMWYATTADFPPGWWLMLVQAVAVATLVALLRRGGGSADVVIDAALRTEQQARAEVVRRADEREQHRQLHDTVLSTFTMIATGAVAARSEAVSAQAFRDLEVLRGLAASGLAASGPSAPDGDVDLCTRLEKVAEQAVPLRTRLTSASVTVPSAVCESIANSAAEALRNVARHAHVGEADITVAGGDGWVLVEITDHGRGFDLGRIPLGRRGITESVVGRMTAAGGTAAVTSRPGAGTTVTLRWTR
jgi:signal transduction histidine kinase